MCLKDVKIRIRIYMSGERYKTRCFVVNKPFLDVEQKVLIVLYTCNGMNKKTCRANGFVINKQLGNNDNCGISTLCSNSYT